MAHTYRWDVILGKLRSDDRDDQRRAAHGRLGEETVEVATTKDGWRAVLAIARVAAWLTSDGSSAAARLAATR